MKKVIILLMTCLMSLSMQAQEEHLKFMGIPMGGSLKDFHQELVEKGLKRTIKLDTGWQYEGIFAGYESTIQVLYTAKSRLVKGVGVSIKCYSEANMETISESLNNSIKSKYEKDPGVQLFLKFYEMYKDSVSKELLETFQWIRNVNTGDGTEYVVYIIPRPTKEAIDNKLGLISVGKKIGINPVTYIKEYLVEIIYSDDKTSHEGIKEIEDDL